MVNGEIKKNDSNVCGIIGLCTGWAFPLSGFVLGIIGLCRKEKTPAIGILSIIISIIMAAVWIM